MTKNIDDFFENDTNKVVLDGLENHLIISLGNNIFHYEDPKETGFFKKYFNIIFRKQYMFVYGEFGGDCLVINHGGNPINFLKVCAHPDYLKSHSVRSNISDIEYRGILPLLQQFYRAFINQKLKLNKLEY